MPTADPPSFIPPGGPRPGAPTQAQIDAQIPQGGMYGNMRQAMYGVYGYGPSGPYQNAAESQASQSHVNQQGPVGGSQWAQDPSTGQWTQTQQFTGPFQDIFANLSQQMGSRGLDYGQDARMGAENAAYGAA